MSQPVCQPHSVPGQEGAGSRLVIQCLVQDAIGGLQHYQTTAGKESDWMRAIVGSESADLSMM